MNWTGPDLKSEARAALKKNYWKSVLVALILMLITGGLETGYSIFSDITNGFNEIHDDFNGRYESYDYSYYDHADGVLMSSTPEDMARIAVIYGGIVVIVFFISIALKLFLFGPLHVGCARFSELAIKIPADFNLGRGFSVNYWNVVKIMFMKGLFTVLWGFLYFALFGVIDYAFLLVMISGHIPPEMDGLFLILIFISGLVILFMYVFRMYNYKMIPYILASDPNMERREVFRIAKEMVDGIKFDIFFLQLSFFGWELLSAFTFGILHIFYVGPYIMLTDGALFHKLTERVNLSVNMQGNIVMPTGGNMSGGNDIYNNGNIPNSGFSNSDFNKNDNENGGYIGVDNNNGDHYSGNENSGYIGAGSNSNGNNDGHGSGSYGNGAYGNSGMNNSGYGGSGYNNPGGYGGSGYNNAGGYGGSGYNNAGGYGGSGYNSPGGYGGSGYNNAGGYDGSGNDKGSAGYGHQNSNYYNDDPEDDALEYKGAGNPENTSYGMNNYDSEW